MKSEIVESLLYSKISNSLEKCTAVESDIMDKMDIAYRDLKNKLADDNVEFLTNLEALHAKILIENCDRYFLESFKAGCKIGAETWSE